jgi:pimeloyl-ACP methyl ester carboxylesterase
MFAEGLPQHPDVVAWAARGDWLAVDARRIFVIDVPARDASGALDPLLVIHGFPSSSFDLRHVIDAFAARRRVVAFDCLGFGLSDKPDIRYGMRLQADVATAVVDQLGIGRVALLSHDMGDTVGGELLARDLEGTLPFAVSDRVLTNGSIYIDMAQLTPGQLLLSQLPDARTDLVGEDGFCAGLASTFAPGHPPSADELAAQWQLMAHLDGNTLMPRLIRYLEDRRAEEARFTGAIERHPSRLGVVWGALDPVAVYPMTDTLLAARPGTERITLDDVGHYPMIEAPDRFAAAGLALRDRPG